MTTITTWRGLTQDETEEYGKQGQVFRIYGRGNSKPLGKFLEKTLSLT